MAIIPVTHNNRQKCLHSQLSSECSFYLLILHFCKVITVILSAILCASVHKVCISTYVFYVRMYMSVFGLHWFFLKFYINWANLCSHPHFTNAWPSTLKILFNEEASRFSSFCFIVAMLSRSAFTQMELAGYLGVTLGDKSINSPGSSPMLVSGLGLKWLCCALGY